MEQVTKGVNHGQEQARTYGTKIGSNGCSDMALSSIEQRLKAHLLHDCAECLRLRPPYNPYIFQRMIGEHGPVEACRRVIMELPAHQAPSGYGQLWERGRLDLTAKATVINPDFSALFDEAVIQRAKARLERCGWRPDG
jgi:hypothetical protein